MASSLLEAVHVRFNSNPALTTALPGGLWTSEVPENQNIAYASLEHGGTSFEYTRCIEKRIELSTVTFFVFDRGAELVQNVFDELLPFFTGTNVLEFDYPRQLMVMRPTSFVLTSTPARWKDGSHVFQGTVSFEVQVSYYDQS